MGPVFAQFGNANLVVFVSFCGFEALPSEQVTADGSPDLPSTLFCLHFFPLILKIQRLFTFLARLGKKVRNGAEKQKGWTHIA